MALELNTPISQIPRIGKKYYKKFHKLGINTVRDLIYHFPHRYDDFSNLVPIAQLKLEQEKTIQGKVLDIENTRTPRKRMSLTEAIIKDDSGTIKAVWFNRPYIAKVLKPGQKISLSGKLKVRKGEHYLSNPSYEVMREYKFLAHTAGLIPVYPETAGITSRVIRFALKTSLPVINKIKDYLPAKIKRSNNLFSLKKALKEVHFPQDKNSAKKARQRLAFDELFLIQLFSIKQKKSLQKQKARAIEFDKKIIKSFVDKLSFNLTNSQKIAMWDILQDISKPFPMNRLLNGDVGSGKTVVAAAAMLEVAKNNSQVAFMAPTEILAQQHFKEIIKLLKGHNLTVGLLTGSENKIQNKKLTRKEFLNRVENGEIDIIIGTHALIAQKKNQKRTVKFNNLTLAIIDEQHRFGIKQRSHLRKNFKDQKIFPHFLTLTATPIPRTLTLTIYGDLDISLLKEMPKGRQKIITEIVPPEDRRKVYKFVKQQASSGRQVFVICPLIEESEKLEVKSVTQEYEKLKNKIFPDLNIEMLHGKMPADKKQKIMEDFKNKKTDVLISTSVVEVGIDVPNATAMMIEGAERFGLAQLHQFRGRVGRGKYQSYCFLLTSSSLKTSTSRLNALKKCKNGFELAEKDLKIRGPGELFGVRQSGLPDLAMANLGNIKLIEKTRKEASNLLEQDPQLKNHPLLLVKLSQFNQFIHLE